MDREKRVRLIRVSVILLSLFIICILIYLVRPPCLILTHTGFYCAGCGCQRMISALLHGNIAAAFSHNPFLFILFPILAVYIFWEAARYVLQKPPIYKMKLFIPAVLAILAVSAVFTLLRNLPVFPFLKP